MSRTILSIYISFFIIGFSSCSQKKKNPYQPPQELNQLVAGDSAKVWKLARRYNGSTRMNMGDCFLGYRQTFRSDGTVIDNNSHLSNCGKSLSGQWNIFKDSTGFTYIRIESSLIPELMNIDETYKDFRVFFANKDSLHISFIHKQFGKERRISDYLVEESIEVKDRDFHF